jgi:hypothetical protein
MVDDHEYVEQPEGRRDRDEEVAGANCFGVVTEKRGPTLIATRPTRRPSRHVLADGAR